MHYSILLYAAEPSEGQIDPDVIAKMQEAYQKYARDLVAAGVRVSGEVLTDAEDAVCVEQRDGALRLNVGALEQRSTPLVAVFTVDVEGRDDAVGWAKRCPGVSYGAVEVRAAGTSIMPDGSWS